MAVKTYRRKPTTIEAVRWTGDNAAELRSWAVMPDGVPCFVSMDEEDAETTLGAEVFERFGDSGTTAALWVAANTQWLPIADGEWVAKDKIGFYPIKDEVFIETYEEEGGVIE